jgi:ribosomal protein S18 acetylase RimI-like enzyme
VKAETRIVVRSLTPDRWPDVEAIFSARGCSVARSCWCMYYRRTGSSPPPAGKTRAQVNRAALKALAKADPPAGLIGYRGRTPVGWISLGPREDFKRLARSSVMKAVDDQPVWSVICFVVPAEHRHQGVANAMLAAAIAYAKRRGVKLLEAYPVDKTPPLSDGSLWFGAKSMYDAAGFREVARRKPTRPVVRLTLAE